MKYTPLWAAITGMVVLTVLYLNIDGSIDSKMLDISTWNEKNVSFSWLCVVLSHITY
jgi:hypothetical protein